MNKKEFLTIEEIAEGFRSQDFTPSSILDYFFNNINQNRKINAYISTYEDDAVLMAEKFDKLFKEGNELDLGSVFVIFTLHGLLKN